MGGERIYFVLMCCQVFCSDPSLAFLCHMHTLNILCNANDSSDSDDIFQAKSC